MVARGSHEAELVGTTACKLSVGKPPPTTHVIACVCLQDSAWQLEATWLVSVCDASLVELCTTTIDSDQVWYDAVF